MLARIDALAMAALSRRRFLTTLGAYLFILLALRVFMFSGASEDDAEQLLYSQIWAFGYKANQPPLYTWLVLMSQQIFGVTILSVEAVKFAALFAMYGFYHQAARLVLGDDRSVTLATLSLVGFYYIGWDMVMNYSHTVLMGAAIAATLWAAFRLRDYHDFRDYLFLGLAIGCGLLSKYNYALFLVALAAACIADKEFRRVLRPRNLWLTAAVAAVMVSPHALWVAFHEVDVTTIHTAPPPEVGVIAYLLDAGRGLLGLGEGIAAFLSPAIILMVLFFWRAFGRISGSKISQPFKRLLEAYFISVVLMLILAVAVFRIGDFQNHWLMVLIPFPIYVFLRIKCMEPPDRWLSRYGVAIGMLAVVVIAGVVGRYVVGPDICRKCNFFLPYEVLAKDLRTAGFDHGTMISPGFPNQLSGNLRRYFPDSRFVSMRFAPFMPPPRAEQGACIIVWNAVFGSDRKTWGGYVQFANQNLGTSIGENPAVHLLEAEIPRAGGRRVTLAYIPVTEEKGSCH